MKVLIVFVNYNTTDLLVKCLDSIRNQKIQTDYSIVVVDNHSQDGAVERLKRDYLQVTVIANTNNHGYARAVNQAIRVFGSEYVLLLNPDIEVKPGAIDAMVKFMKETKDVGILGGKLRHPDGTVSVLLTNLLNTLAYPRESLLVLYFRRWKREDYYRDKKITLQLEQFHRRPPGGGNNRFFPMG